tara:strand:- start:45 stop:275 length:231 start_codon:yes stop_codon:yes gene_type:complete
MKAFPTQESVYENLAGVKQVVLGQEGMDLRDYFAAKAMQGKLANPNYQQEIIDKGQEWILEDVFAWADAMMEARNA